MKLAFQDIGQGWFHRSTTYLSTCFYLRHRGVFRLPPFQAGSQQGEAEDVHISFNPAGLFYSVSSCGDPEGWQARHVVLPLWGEGHRREGNEYGG